MGWKDSVSNEGLKQMNKKAVNIGNGTACVKHTPPLRYVSLTQKKTVQSKRLTCKCCLCTTIERGKYFQCLAIRKANRTPLRSKDRLMFGTEKVQPSFSEFRNQQNHLFSRHRGIHEEALLTCNP